MVRVKECGTQISFPGILGEAYICTDNGVDGRLFSIDLHSSTTIVRVMNSTRLGFVSSNQYPRLSKLFPRELCVHSMPMPDTSSW